MHTPLSNETPSVPDTSRPDTAQVHQGQLQDYELLLSTLKEKVTSLALFSQTLIRPHPSSPLGQENAIGQVALRSLIEDPDFKGLCLDNGVSANNLIVTLEDGNFVYETSDADGANRTRLSLQGNSIWQELRIVIEKSVAWMGGQIRHDGLVSVPRFATFHGMAPWNPTVAAEHQTAIEILEDIHASYQLGLEEDFNLLDLISSPFEAAGQHFFHGDQSDESRDELNRQFMTGEIKKVIQRVLPEEIASPLSHLANDILSSASLESVRIQPAVFLQKILQSDEAQELGDTLLSALDWYGTKRGEETAPNIRTKVVANALQIWFTSQVIEYPDRIAGYDLQSRLNWGKSYKAIWTDFEQHLQASKRAASEAEAIVMARLFLCRFPTEFQIRDIPEELPYRGTVAWVNFVNGVNLVHAISSRALSGYRFERLINLPLKISETASQDQLYGVALARLRPTMEWATSQNIIPEKPFEEYTQAQIDIAVSELDKCTRELTDTPAELDKLPPERLALAKAVIEDIPPKLSDKNSLFNNFSWNDHELALFTQDRYWERVRYCIDDIVAENKLGNNEHWVVFKKGTNTENFALFIDEHRNLHVETRNTCNAYGVIPDIKKLFEKKFGDYMASLTSAYETLIRHLLSSLTYSDREALERGTLKIYTLRRKSDELSPLQNNQKNVLPLRARNGLLLTTRYNGIVRTFELLPRAAVIRRINNLDPGQFGGVLKTETRGIGLAQYLAKFLDHQMLPFDWKAHSTGSLPTNAARCEAIIEQLGDSFHAPATVPEDADDLVLTLSSKRCKEISHFIATHLLFIDPEALRESAYGQTKFDRETSSRKKIQDFFTSLVPIWGAIDNMTSNDLERKVNGAFGLGMDVALFIAPIGKLVSGSVKLLRNTGQLTVGARLIAFSTLVKDVTILALQSLNPLLLFQALGSVALKLGKSGIFRIKATAGMAGDYNFVKSVPRINNAGRWKPLSTSDQLATVRGVDDVHVRTALPLRSGFYLIDPRSYRPFGPRLLTSSGEVSQGRSNYSIVKRNEELAFVEVPGQTRSRQVLEIDGRTTVFIDDVPYRIDRNALRRFDLIDDSKQWTPIPCRPRRVPGHSGECRVSYVAGNEPAPTPPIDTIDKKKGYAPWFGDRVSEPAPLRGHEGEFLALDNQLYRITNDKPTLFTGNLAMLGFKRGKLIPRQQTRAILQFRKGIFARVNVKGTYDGIDDSHRVGAILVPAIDDSAQYAFFRVNTREYYLATIPKGQTPGKELTFHRIPPDQMAEGTLGAELLVVYEGGLMANNNARIHKLEDIERAMKTMEEIALPLGVPSDPPITMKWLKLDTSPGEALMYDHRTRMIIAQKQEGATAWTRSKDASQAFRERTAEIFDTLFLSPVINPANAGASLRIDSTMQKLQTLLPRYERPLNARNIAYADVTTTNGKREIYVSVSGAQGSTTRLPLFRHLGANHVRIGDTTYINIDYNQSFPRTSLDLTNDDHLLAVPLTIKNIGTYHPSMAVRPTSLDSESKLIRVLREKYPDPNELRSVDIATTMRPCESCSMVMKEFGHTGGADALRVLWQ
ncbi:hypothetical protein [Pseudomonas sp. NPDC089569]|uniref:hypothetical protein n=1 Tax=Pseudomonas sp. NPDC089569 TaxID=3390722 RepID=UPI003D06F114